MSRADVAAHASRSAAFLVAIALTFATSGVAVAQEVSMDPTALLRRAAEAYEEGQCAEVLASYAELEQDSEDGIDGVSHYRWGFCIARSRQSGAEDHYRKAAELLEVETDAASAPIDAHFYRVNALLNLKESDKAREAASDATSKWNAGTLVVDAERPESWFRLGKMFHDAGDEKGALEPFGRALDLVEDKRRPLRDAYIERIARWSAEQGDESLATRAARLLGADTSSSPEDAIRLARIDIGLGKLQRARDRFQAARSAGGDLGMSAQYSAISVERALEVLKWELEPAKTLSDGRKIAALDAPELSSQIRELMEEISEAMDGPTVEVKRKRGKGTKLVPAQEVRKQLKNLQARLAGLLLEAVQRGVDLREWAITGGYAQMLHHGPLKLFTQRALAKRGADSQEAGTLEESQPKE